MAMSPWIRGFTGSGSVKSGGSGTTQNTLSSDQRTAGFSRIIYGQRKTKQTNKNEQKQTKNKTDFPARCQCEFSLNIAAMCSRVRGGGWWARGLWPQWCLAFCGRRSSVVVRGSVEGFSRNSPASRQIIITQNGEEWLLDVHLAAGRVLEGERGGNLPVILTDRLRPLRWSMAIGPFACHCAPRNSPNTSGS